jgi:hypothetical protein
MRRGYGDDVQLPNASGKDTASAPKDLPKKKSQWEMFQIHDGDFEGGFIQDDVEAGGFVHDGPSASSHQELENGTLTVDPGYGEETHESSSPAESSPRTPISLQDSTQMTDRETQWRYEIGCPTRHPKRRTNTTASRHFQ